MPTQEPNTTEVALTEFQAAWIRRKIQNADKTKFQISKAIGSSMLDLRLCVYRKSNFTLEQLSKLKTIIGENLPNA